MIGLIIFILLPIICSILAIIFYRKKYLNLHTISVILGLLSIVIFVIIVLGRYSRPNINQQIILRYNSLKNKTEVINSFPEDIKSSIDTLFPEFKKQIGEINQTIRVNKSGCTSSINGWIFSEEIANLEEIQYE